MRHFGVFVLLLSLVALAHAYETYTESPPFIVDEPGFYEPVPPGEPTDALTFYTDQAAFEALFPGLTQEDYSATLVPPNSVASDTGPINYLTDNSLFAPGGIVEGFSLHNLQDTENVVLTPPFAGVDCVSVGPNTFADDAEYTFDVSVNAFGVEIVMPNGSAEINMEIFGASGSLGTTTATGTPAGAFWGVSSDDEYIIRIEFDDPTDNGELFSNPQFGFYVSLQNETWGSIKSSF